jgi:DNA repair photolyase
MNIHYKAGMVEYEERAYHQGIIRRVEALAVLHSAGIKTFVMVAPLLPGAEGLVEVLKGKVDHVLIDRLNYHYADWVYKKHGIPRAMDDSYFEQMGEDLRTAFERQGIDCKKLF